MNQPWPASDRQVDDSLVSRVPPEVALRYQVFPLAEAPGGLVLAMSDPRNVLLQDELRLVLGCQVFPVAMDRQEIMGLVDRYYGAGTQTVKSVLADMEAVEVVRDFEDETQPAGNGETLANDAPVVKLVNSMIVEALQRNASDINIEPFENDLRVRYRIDGVLYEVTPPPKKLFWAIASRIKIMAGLNIAEKRLPQDGRIKVRMMGKDIDIRVSTAPTLYGESVVLRLLERGSVLLGLAELGFSEENLARFKALIERSHGIILVTGPTGSGKTTTLYAALNAINTPDKKIITIEDPVEYQLRGINQMQVKEKIGFGFANGLRHILRQDPDVIMVGEIRDGETARMAIQAALTGHLVFSTLHTNDAPSAITRLVDMGIEPFLVASTVRGVLAQRLVRLLCPSCRESFVPSPGESPVYRAVGCEKCDNIGYRGRTAIYELIEMDEDLAQATLARASSDQIRSRAKARGFVTMREDGFKKAAQGVTTVQEVLRVTQE